MKHIFIITLMFFLIPLQADAQLMDDLFEEEDFQSSEIEKMQQQEAERKKQQEAERKKQQEAEEKKEKELSRQKKSVSVQPETKSAVVRQAVESVPSDAVAQTVSAPLAEKPKSQTFFLQETKPQKIEAIALPNIGSGKMPDLPDLGSKAHQKEDENLSLFEMRAKKTGTSDTDVLKFDIAGIRLKMKPEEVIEKALSSGFSLKFQDRKIPTLNEWKYRRLCMQQMLFKYDMKKRCVQEIAKYNNSEYISRLVFENKDLRETLSVEFASRFSENRAYRVRYVSKGDHSLGATDEAHYLKSKRRQEFLRLLITKYGAPDDEKALLWGVSGVTATLQAEITPSFLDISLVLEDLSIENDDFDNMSIDDAKSPSIEKFSF